MKGSRLECTALISFCLFGLAGCIGSEAPTAENIADNVTSTISSHLKAGVTAVQDIAGKLPPTARIVYASEQCGISPDGRAHCGEAAARVCRTKGFSSGKPADVTSVDPCRFNPSPALRLGVSAICKTKYQVAAAFCW